MIFGCLKHCKQFQIFFSKVLFDYLNLYFVHTQSFMLFIKVDTHIVYVCWMVNVGLHCMVEGGDSSRAGASPVSIPTATLLSSQLLVVFHLVQIQPPTTSLQINSNRRRLEHAACWFCWKYWKLIKDCKKCLLMHHFMPMFSLGLLIVLIVPTGQQPSVLRNNNISSVPIRIRTKMFL